MDKTIYGDAMNIKTILKPCLGCKKPAASVEFQRGKFQREVGNPDGWRVRCECCALQTCWWHSEIEAIVHWNQRTEAIDSLKCDKLARVREYVSKHGTEYCKVGEKYRFARDVLNFIDKEQS